MTLTPNESALIAAGAALADALAVLASYGAVAQWARSIGVDAAAALAQWGEVSGRIVGRP